MKESTDQKMIFIFVIYWFLNVSSKGSNPFCPCQLKGTGKESYISNFLVLRKMGWDRGFTFLAFLACT